MGIFDFFKNNMEQSSNKNLSLESVLQKAASEPKYRPELYKRLLSDKLVVLTKDNEGHEGFRMANAGERISVLNLPGGKIPIFTSKAKIYDNNVLKQKFSVLEIKGEDLFTLIKGATAVLNPYSNIRKELTSSEIEQMLDGTIFTAPHSQIRFDEPTPIIFNQQPPKYPTELVSELQKLYATKPSVKAAYLAWIKIPSSNEPPHYIIAIDCDGEDRPLNKEAYIVVKHFLGPNEIVDFFKIDDRGGISDYFKKTEPFYKK